MTDTPIAPHAASLMSSPVPALVPESFWSILLRRSRYVLAIAVAAVVFSLLGWSIVAPPPAMAGVTLLGWTSLGGAVVTGGLLLVLLLIVAVVCTLIVHPDAPHVGLFCALAGMAAFAIRGGTSHMLIQYAQFTSGYPALCKTLAAESVLWLVFVAVAEVVARMAHDRYFANTHWITRSGSDLPEASVRTFSRNRGEHRGVSLAVSRAVGTKGLNSAIATPLAMIYSLLVSLLLLYLTLQSPEKGQVLFACFITFFLSTANAYLAFPRVRPMAFFLAVPLAAMVGYLWASGSTTTPFPGQGGHFITRALPIDYITAGIPGAIIGYYTAVRWSLHSHEGD